LPTIVTGTTRLLGLDSCETGIEGHRGFNVARMKPLDVARVLTGLAIRHALPFRK
jgi:hypothetical protein